MPKPSTEVRRLSEAEGLNELIITGVGTNRVRAEVVLSSPLKDGTRGWVTVPYPTIDEALRALILVMANDARGRDGGHWP